MFRTRVFGCCLAFISAVLYAIQGMFFELLDSLYSMEKVLLRSVGILLLTGVIVLYRKDTVITQRDDLKWLMVIAVGGAVGSPCRFYSIVIMPYADSFALSLSGIMILTLVFGRIFLKESCGVFETISAAVILTGMCLVSDPRQVLTDFSTTDRVNGTSGWDNLSHAKRFIGITLAIVECIAAAVMALSARRIQHIHFGITMMYGAIGYSASSSLLTVVFGTFTLPLSSSEWLYAAGFVAASVLFHASVFHSYTLIDAGTVSTIRTSEIPASFILQVLVLNVQPTLTVLCGAVIICIATAIFGIGTCYRAKNLDGDDERNKLFDGK